MESDNGPHQSSPQLAFQSGGNVKARTSILTLSLCFVGAAVCFADEPQMGTWKLNEAKSKIAAGSPKSTTVVYEAAGDNVKITVDGTAGDGKRTNNEWTRQLTGKNYPLPRQRNPPT